MTEKDQKRLKGFSKATSIILLIAKICLIIVVPIIVLTMVALPVIFKDIKITENEISYKNIGSIVIDETRTKMDVVYQGDVIHTEENAQALIKIIDLFEENSSDYMVKYIDCKLGIAFVSIIISIVILTKMRKLLNNIHNEETPFIEDNVFLLKRIALLSLLEIIIPLCMDFVLSIILHINLTISIGLSSVMEILIIMCLVYIFKYGTLLQEKSKEKIYE